MSAYQKSVTKAKTEPHGSVSKVKASETRKMTPGQLLNAPETMRPEDVLTAQKEFGNQVVQRALDEEKQEPTDKQGNLHDELSSTIQQSRGNGASLPKNLQQDIGKKLNHDFSNVRLHTDEKADKLSRAIHARAFTIGSDIYFKNGVFAPSTQKGRETLVHELTHVVQQSNSKFSGGKLKLGSPGSAMEKEADLKGKQGSQSVISAPSPAVQRAEEEEELQMQSEEEEEIQMQSEEEELQMQEDEEELQMQEEEEEIQMQEEEEELQMQEDEEEIQMQGEEEELQMQEDEEEIQMQPDAGGVVQRGITDWFKKKKKDPALNPPEFKPTVKPVTPRGKPLTAKGQQVLDTIKATKPSSRTMQEQIASKAKHMGSSDASSTRAKARLASSTQKVEDEQSHRFSRDVAQGVDTKKMVQVSQKETLVRTLKNPNATEQERQDAESQLREFHKSGPFKKNPATVALDERRKLLKEKAKSGDKNAMDLYRKEKAPSFLSKAKGFYGKHKDTFGKIGSMAGKALGMGGDEKEEAKGSGGGDRGGYAVIIAQLMQENKMLKDQLGKK